MFIEITKLMLDGNIKKILYVISSSSYSGAEKLLLDLVTFVDKEKFNVSVLCLNDNEKISEEFSKKGFDVHFIVKERGNFLKYFFQIYKFIKKGKFDIVHTHLFGADIFGGIAAKIAGVKKIISTEHNINLSEGFTKHIIKTIVLNTCFNNVIAISSSVNKYVNNKYKFNQNKIVKIFNGIDLDKFYKTEILDNDVVNMAIVGRFNKQKGHEILINALPNLDFNFKMFLIGDGEEKDRILSLAEDLSVDHKIEFTGFRDNVNELLKNIDILIIPSLWEGFGLVAVEGMASSKIVVASNVDGLTDIIKDNYNGILFNVSDSNSLSDKLNWVVKHKAESKMIANQGYLDSKKFDIKKMVNEYQNIYLM